MYCYANAKASYGKTYYTPQWINKNPKKVLQMELYKLRNDIEKI